MVGTVLRAQGGGGGSGFREGEAKQAAQKQGNGAGARVVSSGPPGTLGATFLLGLPQVYEGYGKEALTQ